VHSPDGFGTNSDAAHRNSARRLPRRHGAASESRLSNDFATANSLPPLLCWSMRCATGAPKAVAEACERESFWEETLDTFRKHLVFSRLLSEICGRVYARALPRHSTAKRLPITSYQDRSPPTSFLRIPLFLGALAAWRSIVIVLGIIRNQQVVGSNPAGGSRNFDKISCGPPDPLSCRGCLICSPQSRLK
jgi:hypothetical protein